MNLQLLCNQAIAHHRAGREAEAEPLYLTILAADPGNFTASHMLGLVRRGQGRNQEALELIGAALKNNPAFPEALSDYGLVLAELGRLDEALASYEQALKIGPDSAGALFNRGVALQGLKRFEEALASFDRFLALRPDFAVAHLERGIALSELKRNDEALASFGRALALQPDYAQAFNNRGTVQLTLGRLAPALADFDAALAIEPGFAPAWLNRGNVLMALKRFGDALTSYDKAVAAVPQFADAWNGRGTALQHLLRHDEALKAYDRALALGPEFGEVHYNRGITLTDLGRYDEALAAYDRAIVLDCRRGQALRNQGLCNLLLGRFEPGLRLYEGRKELEAFPKPPGKPLWLGREDITGKTLLITWEQGFGDTIQFCRYAMLCKARGANVVLSVQAPLAGFLRQLEPEITVIGPGEAPPEFDFHCPMLSLPLAFGTSLETIPAATPYLSANAALKNQWAARLPAEPRIGIAWRGASGHTGDPHRSMDLEQLLPLLVPDREWICLQKLVEGRDLSVLQDHGKIAYFGDGQKDFGDTAAMIALMDLVITVDTSVAHLAGAMGKPVFILLPFNPDWRWLLDRTDSPWYPSACLFRQSRIGDWDGVLERVREALAQRP